MNLSLEQSSLRVINTNLCLLSCQPPKSGTWKILITAEYYEILRETDFCALNSIKGQPLDVCCVLLIPDDLNLQVIVLPHWKRASEMTAQTILFEQVAESIMEISETGYDSFLVCVENDDQALLAAEDGAGTLQEALTKVLIRRQLSISTAKIASY